MLEYVGAVSSCLLRKMSVSMETAGKQVVSIERACETCPEKVVLFRATLAVKGLRKH